MKAKKDTRQSVEILQHTVKYYYDNDMVMPDIEEEHVKEMIIEGYSAGELNYLTNKGKEVRGYWEIVKD